MAMMRGAALQGSPASGVLAAAPPSAALHRAAKAAGR